MRHDRLLFHSSIEDKPYLMRLKSCVGTATCAVITGNITTFYELRKLAESKHATAVISTSTELLNKFLQHLGCEQKGNINNYAGSLFKIPQSDIEVLFVSPLEQLMTTPYGAFLTSRYITKLIRPDDWITPTKFSWEIFDPSRAEELYHEFSRAFAIAIDIETTKEPPAIRCVGYTALFYDATIGFTSKTLVIPCDSIFNLTYIRKFNSLNAQKIFQKGQYDISYLQAYGAAPVNYLWDTAGLFHAWYAELPKDLGALAAFFIRDVIYWKDLSQTNNLSEYYRYCGLDTWGTANVFLAWMAAAPDWARTNYANSFPIQFPCHLAEMNGIKRDMDELKLALAENQKLIAEKSARLDKLLGVRDFNVNSPKQMQQLVRMLGCHDITSTKEQELNKVAFRHPLNALIVGLVLDIRGYRKLVSTYLTPGKEFCGHLGNKEGRILFALNPHGTDTGRLASSEHHFWCGLQIQNIPRGVDVKRTLVADTGFVIAECDLEQAESRDTAHIAGDESLIDAVTGIRDFHSVNASAFFGVAYDRIYSDELHKTIDKALRDLAKRVNHGANYNMGPGVLVDTMGLAKIYEAQTKLGLPKLMTPLQIAQYLLDTFHKTYPKISGVYYPAVVREVMTTRMLTSRARHHVEYQASPAGWVRYCFGNPDKNKRHLNAYVAHPPQSLNAMTLNRAYMKVFYEIAMHPDYSGDFKLGPQIHDSILFQFREGRKELPEKVSSCMQIPVSVKGYDNKDRTFTVPASIKAGKNGDGAHRWSETE